MKKINLMITILILIGNSTIQTSEIQKTTGNTKGHGDAKFYPVKQALLVYPDKKTSPQDVQKARELLERLGKSYPQN